MQDSLIYVCEHAAKLLKRYGFPEYAAHALGLSLSTLVSKKEFEKARQYMHIYESESGFFDSAGNINPGREIYYRVKGLYFLGINKLDSAEYYFRKELHEGKDLNNQNAGAKGLSELYQCLSLYNVDSF